MTVKNTEIKQEKLIYWLSDYLAKWLDDEFSVIITSDHGMNKDGTHGGNLDIETDIPMFVFGELFSLEDASIKQTEICGTICKILGVSHDKSSNLNILRSIHE